LLCFIWFELAFKTTVYSRV